MAKGTLTLPNGKSVTLEGTRKQITEDARRLDEAFQQRGRGIPEVIAPEATGPPVSGSEAFNRQALERTLGNVSGLADIALNPQTRFGPQQFETRSGAPVQTTQGVPLPTGEQIGAGIDVAGQLPGAVVRGEPLQPGQRFQQSLQRGQRAEEERPGFTLGGTLAGDALTLAGGRAPVSAGIQGAERRLLDVAPLQVERSSRRVVQQLLTRNKSMRKLLRGAGRSTEAGLEGAILSTLQEGDPLEVAATAAGLQAGGSGFLTLGKEAFKGGAGSAGLKIGAASLGVGALIQIAKDVTPGGRDFFLESVESGFEKVAAGLALGGLAGLAGAGRLRGGKVTENLPRFFDAFQTSFQRGPAISALRGWVDADEPDKVAIEATIKQLRQDPDFFGRKARDKLQKALTNKDVSLKDTIKSLRENTDFDTRLEALTSKVTETPPE